jgi:argininosuccinate synthase
MAYSGGLDASVCIHWLRRSRGYEVITFSADLGQDISAESLANRALALGATSALSSDLRERFLKEFAFPALVAGARAMSGSYLSIALSRPFITAEVVRIAQEVNCDFIAHGGRGKSNDQARFQACVDALAPQLRVIAPLREKQFLSRNGAIEYAKRYGLPVGETDHKTYSYDQNLWGTAIGSTDIEDLWAEPPAGLFGGTKSPEEAPDKVTYIEVGFRKGEPVSLDSEALASVLLVERLNRMGAQNGVGRLDAVETRITGIKARMVYESPGAHILYTALGALEEVILPESVLEAKRLASVRYTELIHKGLWFTGEREALDAFFRKIGATLTGAVRVKLYKGNCTVVGRKSEFSLYDRTLATIGPEDRFDYTAAAGFLEITGIPVRLESRQRKKISDSGD